MAEQKETPGLCAAPPAAKSKETAHQNSVPGQKPALTQAGQEFERKVLDFCAKEGLFAAKNRVIAAVSGGADSMALLVFLLRCAADLGVTVEAVHVDHGIRGAASAADAAFVAEFCAARGTPLHAFSAKKAGIPVPERPSEDWARRLRYGFFEQLLTGAAGTASPGRNETPSGPDTARLSLSGRGTPPEDPGIRIATAHTLNDQAETLLFRLARGTGLHGASGIRPARGGYVRPLLAVSREEVEGYCAALSIPYVQDETNAGPAYARNRLRAGALPALGSVNGAALEHIAGFCEQMRQLDGYFAAKGETLLQTAAAAAERAKPAAARRGGDGSCPADGAFAGVWSLEVLRTALETDGPVLDAALLILLAGLSPRQRIIGLVKGLIARGEGSVQLTADLALTAGQGVLRLREAHNVSGPKMKTL